MKWSYQIKKQKLYDNCERVAYDVPYPPKDKQSHKINHFNGNSKWKFHKKPIRKKMNKGINNGKQLPVYFKCRKVGHYNDKCRPNKR